MTSYHRILKLFGRSVDQYTLQCDCDLHPWQVSINGEQWGGKIRLVAFIDTVFLISYTQQSCFQRGIVIYKDDEDIQSIVARAKEANEHEIDMSSGACDVQLEMMQDANTNTQLKFTRDSMEYKFTSIGHEVGLQTHFRPESVKQYTITVRKPDNSSEKVRIKRAFKKHDTLDIMQDAVKLGYIAYADILGHGLGQLVGGTTAAAIMKNFSQGFGSGQAGQSIGLTGGNL